MRAVQVAILALLVVVAGLLYINWRGKAPESPQAPAPAETATGAVTPETIATPTPEQPGETPIQPAEPAPASKRPSPAPVRAKQSSPPSPAQAAETPPSATPTTQPVAPTQPSQSEPAQPRTILTPPSGTTQEPPPAPAPRKVTIPAGTVLTVRLNETLSSEKNKPGDRFTATLDQPLIVEGLVLAERGARVEGRVLEVEQAGRVRGLASLKVHLVRLHTADGQDVTISTQPFSKTAEPSKAEDAKKIGIGAAVGAAVGAIAGGGRGAAIGAGVGGAAGTGAVLATRGNPAVLPSETRLSFRLQEPVTLVEKLK